MTHVQVFFRKLLSKATFKRKLASVSLALVVVVVVVVWDVWVYTGRNLLGEVQPLLQSRSRQLKELMDEYGLEDLPETEELWEVPEPRIILPPKPGTWFN